MAVVALASRIVVCIREQLQDLEESAKLLIEDELQEFGGPQRSR
jgi:hypothetical protein